MRGGITKFGWRGIFLQKQIRFEELNKYSLSIYRLHQYVKTFVKYIASCTSVTIPCEFVNMRNTTCVESIVSSIHKCCFSQDIRTWTCDHPDGDRIMIWILLRNIIMTSLGPIGFWKRISQLNDYRLWILIRTSWNFLITAISLQVYQSENKNFASLLITYSLNSLLALEWILSE